VVDRDALATRISALEGYLDALEGFRSSDRAAFVQRPDLHHLAERYLHLACECVLDIAHHVIADQGYRQPTSYRDAMEVLREAGHLDADLSRRLAQWMGLRNVLVHFYLGVDHGRVHDAIRDDLGDLRAFARAMAPLLKEGQ
jgi:uncharacterized protein YutE (UPF0331/DUF86 family)